MTEHWRYLLEQALWELQESKESPAIVQKVKKAYVDGYEYREAYWNAPTISIICHGCGKKGMGRLLTLLKAGWRPEDGPNYDCPACSGTEHLVPVNETV